MTLIEERLSEIEKTPFTRDQAEARLDDHFATNSPLGEVKGKDYQGYFLDPFGIDYHAFGVNVTGNGAGINWFGVTVTREMVALSTNPNVYKQTLEFATKLG